MVESEKTGIFYVQPSMVDMIPIGNIKPYKRNAKNIRRNKSNRL